MKDKQTKWLNDCLITSKVVIYSRLRGNHNCVCATWLLFFLFYLIFSDFKKSKYIYVLFVRFYLVISYTNTNSNQTVKEKEKEIVVQSVVDWLLLNLFFIFTSYIFLNRKERKIKKLKVKYHTTTSTIALLYLIFLLSPKKKNIWYI